MEILGHKTGGDFWDTQREQTNHNGHETAAVLSQPHPRVPHRWVTSKREGFVFWGFFGDGAHCKVVSELLKACFLVPRYFCSLSKGATLHGILASGQELSHDSGN